MKKFLLLLLAIILAATGCMNKTHNEFTVLGDYTPYEGYIERLYGKVEKVVEKHYWAKQEGESFVKVNPVTIKDRDSLKWLAYNFEAKFDKDGQLMICNYLDENDKTIGKWEFSKENNVLTLVKGTYKDTLRVYQKLKCDVNGTIIEAIQYSATVDTLMTKISIKVNAKEDTVEYQVYDYKGIPSSKILNLYNDKKQFLSWGQIDKDGVYHVGDEIKYNENGKMSELTLYDKDKKTVGVNFVDYELDQKGNWIRVVAKDEKNNVLIEERTYTYY
jgi:hypothetical protein